VAGAAGGPRPGEDRRRPGGCRRPGRRLPGGHRGAAGAAAAGGASGVGSGGVPAGQSAGRGPAAVAEGHPACPGRSAGARGHFPAGHCVCAAQGRAPGSRRNPVLLLWASCVATGYACGHAVTSRPDGAVPRTAHRRGARPDIPRPEQTGEGNVHIPLPAANSSGSSSRKCWPRSNASAWPGGCTPRPGPPRPGSVCAEPCAQTPGCARHPEHDSGLHDAIAPAK
jgi:hypothetical protein